MPAQRLMVGAHTLVYEELGEGPPLVLTPGVRNSMASMRPIAETLAARFRVIIYDRRNAGASDVDFPTTANEAELWAEDLHLLLGALGASPAFVGGVSLGASASILLAIRHPQDVRALLLGWIIGGPFPRDRLSGALYGQFVEAAESGGMAAVAATPYFAERIAANWHNAERLASLDPATFIATMRRWDQAFREPTAICPLAVGEIERARIAVPTHIIAGDDEIHLTSAARDLQHKIAGAEYHPPMLTRDQWESLGAPAPLNAPERHAAIAKFRAEHVPPLWLAFLRDLV